MNSALSWSIKGIDPETREAAKTAARKSGMTLGQWLNSKITAYAEGEDDASDGGERDDPRSKDAYDERVDQLEERLAALTRVQSDTAFNSNYSVGRPSSARDDEAMQYVIERLNRNETETLRSFDTLHSRLDQLTEAVSQSHMDRSGEPSYEALEKAIDSVVRHIEHSDSATRKSMEDLRTKIDTIGNETHRGSNGAEQASRRIVGEIEQQLTALSHRVDRLNEKGATHNISGLETRLSKLSQRMDSSEKHTSNAIGDLHHQVEQRFGTLAERVDMVGEHARDAVKEAVNAVREQSRDELDAFENKLRDMAAQLQSLGGTGDVTKHAISELREEVSGLSADIDLIKHHAASEHDLQAIREMLDSLSENIEKRFETLNSDAAFDKLERRIADLSSRLNEGLQNPPADPNMEVLERKVHEIDARLAAAQDDDTRQQIMSAVEQQISGVHERLGAAEQRFSGLDTIEKSIAQLFESVEQTRNWAGEAADKAARQMAERLQAEMPSGGGSDDAIRAIEQGLAAVKSSAASADQRTQETLEAVHDTLEKVVTRLIALENQERAPAHAASQRLPDARAEVELPTIATTAPIADEDGPEAEEDVDWRSPIDQKSAQEMEDILANAPLDEEPMQLSASQIEGDEGDDDPRIPGLSDGDDEDDDLDAGPSLNGPASLQDTPINRRNDFIAAARRAAQASSSVYEEPSEKPRSRFSVLRRGKKAAEEAVAAEDSGDEAAAGGKSRRPLLLAAIVLLLIGAVSAYSLLGSKRAADLSSYFTAPTIDIAPASIAPDEPRMLDAAPIEGARGAQEAADIPMLDEAKPRTGMDMLPPGPGTANTDTSMDIAPLEAQPANQTTVTRSPMPETGADAMATGSIPQTAAPGANETRVSMDPMFGSGELQGFSMLPASGAAADQVVERSAPQDTAPSTAASAGDVLPEAIGTAALRTAAAEGNALAQFIVASRFTDGEGIDQDYRQAALWYQRAAAQGLAPAQYRLATLYEKGRGVPQDLAAARIWYERAAEKGNRKAMHNLAVIFADSSRGTPNFAKAALWFRNAAELGLRDSQYNLAILHERGLGVEQNLSEAYRWFALAARQGDTDAQARIGVIESQLNAQELIDAKMEVETWRAQQVVAEANVVTPQATWVAQAAAPQAAPATAGATLSRDMILEAQTLLNTLGYEAGSPDGIMGERTRTAIRTFEGANGLAGTGAVTPELIELLRRQVGV